MKPRPEASLILPPSRNEVGRWQTPLWLTTLFVTITALGCSGIYLLELLGPEATPTLEPLAIFFVALAAASLALLGSLQQGPSRWFGPTAGALMILSLTFAPDPPLIGFVAAGLTSIVGLMSIYGFAREQLSEKTLDHLSGWLFVLPALLLMLVWIYFPAIYAFWISLFKDFNYLGAAEYVGLENYAIAFRDPLFLRALTNTAWYVVGTVPISIFLGGFVAILLNERIKGLPLFRLVYFLPYITALTAAAAVWRWIYNPNVGLLNWVLGLEGFRWLANPDGLFELLLAPLGLSLPQFLAGPSVALCAIMLMSIWHFLGYNVVIFLAGLQAIPREYYEAARIDGASWLQQVRYLTWPLLSPTTFFVLIISLIGSLNVFTQIFIMTPTGGVLNDTLSAVMYLYFKGFRDFDFGYASALAFILFVLTLALTLLQRRIFTRLQGADREAI